MKYLFRRYSYPTVLAFIAAAVLGAGALLRPEHKQAAKTAISEREIARLEKFAQRKSLQGMTKYFSDLAAKVAPQVVRVRHAGASGLVWNREGRIVTAGLPDAALDPVLAVAGEDGQVMPARVASAAPDVPVAVVTAVSGRAQPVVRARTTDAQPGAWVLEIARRSDGTITFAPATFRGTAAVRCGETSFQEVQLSAPIPDGMAGGGVFDMDGNLLALVVHCGGREAAMRVEDVNGVARAGEGPAAAVLRSFGMRVLPANADIPSITAHQGALVSETRTRMPAERSGIIPGDVVTGCDGAPVNTPGDLYSLLLAEPSSPHDLEIRRGTRLVKIKLANATEAREVDFERPARGFVAAAIPQGSRAWRAGLRPGDRVISINRTLARSQAGVERALSENAAPAYIVIERRGRYLGLAVGK